MLGSLILIWQNSEKENSVKPCLKNWSCVTSCSHINISWLFNAKVILLEEQWWYYLTHSWEDNGVHTIPEGIDPKVNVIVRLKFELAYDSTVHCFNHYTTRTPPARIEGLVNSYDYTVKHLNGKKNMNILSRKPL